MKKGAVKTAAGLLLTLGLYVPSAKAEFTASVFGTSNWYLGYAGQDSAAPKNHNDVDVMGSVEIRFRTEKKLSDHFSVGAFLLFNGGTVAYNPNTRAAVKFSYVYMDTAVGRFALGLQDNYAKQMHQGAKEVSVFGVDSSDIYDFVAKRMKNRMTGADCNPSSRRNQVSYVTPKKGGFQIGLNYIPGSSLDTQDNRLSRKDAAFNEAYTGIVTYRKDFSENRGISLSLAGYDMLKPSVHRYEYSLGLRMWMDNFYIGSGAKSQNTEGENGNNPYIINTSIGYDDGEKAFSIAAAYSKDDDRVQNGGFQGKLFMASAKRRIARGVHGFASFASITEKGDFDGAVKKAQTEIITSGISLAF